MRFTYSTYEGLSIYYVFQIRLDSPFNKRFKICLMVGPAIPSLMNRTETGGRTVWQTGIQLEAQDASWIGENHRIRNLYATSCPRRQVGIALGSICYTFPSLQTICDICIPKKNIDKPHSQMSTKFLQNRFKICCHECREVEYQMKPCRCQHREQYVSKKNYEISVATL
jgi:hypothetical protein